MRLFFDPNINASLQTFILSEEESKHIIRVLRMKTNDKLVVLNGKGASFTCEIKENHSKKCELRILKVDQDLPLNYSIHIAIGPTKQMDRMEWFIEKATELGITEISLIACKNQERTKLKIDRLLKKAVSAMKQSQRTFLPKINDIVDLKSFVKSNPNGLIAHCRDEDKHTFNQDFSKTNCPILIGPEGDFTNEEIELALNNGYKAITLGENRLRTETAGLYACMFAKTLIE
jgi:16S rRNA (uracil1498-N3)-methyltransferase